MNKALKIVLWSILGVALITLTTCYIAIPTQTKQFVDVVVEYVNKPLPIVGVSVFALGLIVFKIISITSIGKKSLKDIYEKFDNLQKVVKEKEDNAKEYYNNALKSYKEQKAVLSHYSNEIRELYLQLANICKTSPNVKIKAFAETLIAKLNEFNNSIYRQLEQIDNEIGEENNGNEEESEETTNC